MIYGVVISLLNKESYLGISEYLQFQITLSISVWRLVTILEFIVRHKSNASWNLDVERNSAVQNLSIGVKVVIKRVSSLSLYNYRISANSFLPWIVSTLEYTANISAVKITVFRRVPFSTVFSLYFLHWKTTCSKSLYFIKYSKKV